MKGDRSRRASQVQAGTPGSQRQATGTTEHREQSISERVKLTGRRSALVKEISGGPRLLRSTGRRPM
eukprot:15476269-Alexandrium_andersonii.AAC.1